MHWLGAARAAPNDGHDASHEATSLGFHVAACPCHLCRMQMANVVAGEGCRRRRKLEAQRGLLFAMARNGSARILRSRRGNAEHSRQRMALGSCKDARRYCADL